MMQVHDLLMALNTLTHTQAADIDPLHSRAPIKQKQMKNKLSSWIFTHPPIQMFLYSQTFVGNIKSMVTIFPFRYTNTTQPLTNSV